MSQDAAEAAPVCSFCGRTGDVHRRVIAGLAGAICEECVTLCVRMLTDTDPALTPGSA